MDLESQKPLLITFLGSIGSGKSFFARQLSERMRIARFNPDSARIAVHGSVEALMLRPERDTEYDVMLFKLIDYGVEAVLKSGHSVIYDTARYNGIANRYQVNELADSVGAQVVLVWIKTPRDVATVRATNREERADQRQLSAEKTERYLDFHETNFNPPQVGELVIEISGQIPFDEQYRIFEEQLVHLL